MSVYKALVTVTAWVLFGFGLAALCAGFGRAYSQASLAMVSSYFGFGILSLFFSAVVVKIRSTL